MTKRLLNSTASLLCAILFVSFFASCSNNDEPEEPEIADYGYCLMVYGSGGDPEHDITAMESIKQIARSTSPYADIAVTVLFKASGRDEGEEHNGVRRYTVSDGQLLVDDTFASVDDYPITDPVSMTEFIQWSAQRFPDRKYIFIYIGHGLTFHPYYDVPETETRSTIQDGKKLMTTEQFGQGIRDAAVSIEAIIAHSCQQGSIEMLAEWEGLADYLMGSPYSVPNIGYDYKTLVDALGNDFPVEETLVKTAEATMNIWREYLPLFNSGDSEYGNFIVEITRLRDLTPLWESINKAFENIRNTLNLTSYSSDKPAIKGEVYGSAYLRALRSLKKDDSGDTDRARPRYSIDLPSFFRRAVVYSGNISLIDNVSQVENALDNILVFHEQPNGLHDHIYNVYFEELKTDSKRYGQYRTCRFDKMTRWSYLFETLKTYDTENQ